MGAYLSEPVTTKHTTEDSSDTLVVGASSMQGWRVNQEDAHNTILDFDKGIQMFAVYDGHGGAEVATYCSQMLPKFIREAEAYSLEDLEEALKQAFLNLDASLTKEDVIAELRKIAFPNKSDNEDDDENVANLREEAKMPIEAVIAKYQSDAINAVVRKVKSADGKTPPSPCIRRGGASESGSACSSSEDGGPSASGATSSSEGESSSAAVSSSEKDDSEPAVGSSKSLQMEEIKEETEEEVKQEIKDEKKKLTKSEIKEEEADTKHSETDSVEPSSNGPTTEGSNSKPQVNGDIGHAEKESTENSEAVPGSTETSALKNGTLHETEPVKPKGKGKAKDKSRSVVIVDDEDTKGKGKSPAVRSRSNPVRKLSGIHVMKFLASQEDYSDSEDSEDEEDASFEGKVESSSDDDDECEEDDDNDDDEEGDDEEEDYDETDSEDDDGDEPDSFLKGRDLNEEPGSDSGCTAVVALLRGRDLFVANAGDSRCVVSRNGKAVDMSLDHKPEDPPELARIIVAGGRVTCDGRVNGGLNLSRAIGDHAYKQTEELPPTEQMITALPDVRTLRIDPTQDEFMVLACDGIWNFMTSQGVVNFVRTRLLEKKMKPAQICEELFDHCLSPNTMGDGTGCDNMTAVIVQFQPSLATAPSSLKRDTIFESPISNDPASSLNPNRKKGEVEGTEAKEEDEEGDEELRGKEEETLEEDSGTKKRVVDSSDLEEATSQKTKKIKVDSEANEANGVQV